MPIAIRAAFACAAAISASASAQLATYGFDGTVMPSALGWTYVQLGNGVPANKAFSIDRGFLRQTTIGVGYAGQGANAWTLPVVVPAPSAWTLRSRVKVLASEQWSFPFGCFVGFGNTGVALMANLLSPTAGGWTSYAFDATAWHDYRTEVNPCGRWALFVDGQLFAQGVGSQTSGTLEIYVGDGTGGANANVLYDFVELTVNLGIGADFNGDGDIDAADLAVLLSQWGLPGVTDLDCSGSTDGGDLAVLLSQWS